MATTTGSNRGWIWFFAGLAVLAVAAVSLNVWYNLRQQLKPEDLEQAKALWKAHGPLDYDLHYTEQGSVTATYEVRVRRGRVVYAEPDPRPLEQKRAYYGMPALFGYLERFLECDREPGAPRTFTQATFDPQDGHLIRYVRRVMGTRERLEINVRLEPVADGAQRSGVPESSGPSQPGPR